MSSYQEESPGYVYSRVVYWDFIFVLFPVFCFASFLVGTDRGRTFSGTQAVGLPRAQENSRPQEINGCVLRCRLCWPGTEILTSPLRGDVDLDKTHQIREGTAQTYSWRTSPYVLSGKTSGSFTSAMEKVTGIILSRNEEDPTSFQSGLFRSSWEREM